MRAAQLLWMGHRLVGAGDQVAEAGWPLEAGWWEGCISPLTLGISFFFFPGNFTSILQALLEGLFHVFSLLIKPQPCHFPLVQLLSVVMYSFRIKQKLAYLSLDLVFTNTTGILPFVWISSILLLALIWVVNFSGVGLLFLVNWTIITITCTIFFKIFFM